MDELPVEYAVCEIAVAVLAVIGNLLVLIAFAFERRLRKLTNLYILSLAMSDLLVGLLGIPSALLTRGGLPKSAFRTCLLMLSVLVLLCTVSILNLVAVTLDRYWAILYPFSYKRIMSTRAACGAILACWLLGSLFGLMPLFGWNNGPEADGRCLFIPIMKYNFLVLVYFATIVYPALLMAFCYFRIYTVVVKQLRQIRALEQQIPRSRSQVDVTSGSASGSERSLHRLQNSTVAIPRSRVNLLHQHCSKREVRTAQNLAYIVGFFMICWVPLYTSNCIQAFCSQCHTPQRLLDAFIVLSHANSALNPFLYAYHMSDFRQSLKRFFVCVACLFKPRRSVRNLEMASVSAPVLSKMAAKMAMVKSNSSPNI